MCSLPKSHSAVTAHTCEEGAHDGLHLCPPNKIQTRLEAFHVSLFPSNLIQSNSTQVTPGQFEPGVGGATTPREASLQEPAGGIHLPPDNSHLPEALLSLGAWVTPMPQGLWTRGVRWGGGRARITQPFMRPPVSPACRHSSLNISSNGHGSCQVMFGQGGLASHRILSPAIFVLKTRMMWGHESPLTQVALELGLRSPPFPTARPPPLLHTSCERCSVSWERSTQRQNTTAAIHQPQSPSDTAIASGDFIEGPTWGSGQEAGAVLNFTHSKLVHRRHPGRRSRSLV